MYKTDEKELFVISKPITAILIGSKASSESSSNHDIFLPGNKTKQMLFAQTHRPNSVEEISSDTIFNSEDFKFTDLESTLIKHGEGRDGFTPTITKSKHK